jgi:tetratricopeptide (TPR) repeat protein
VLDEATVRLLTLMVIVALAGRATAGPREDAARAAFEEGRRAYNLGRWQEAVDGFERAYKLTGDPVLLFNLAQAYRQAGRVAQAIGSYRAYLREAGDSPNRALAQAKLRELEEAQRGAPSHPTADPANATPVPVTGPPPPLRPAPVPPSAPAPAAGLDARDQGPPPPDTRSWVPWVGVAATAALAGGATFLGLSVRSRFGELEQTCGRTEAGCDESKISALESRARLTNVLFGLAGAAAVGTGVAFFVTRDAAQASVALRF